MKIITEEETEMPLTELSVQDERDIKSNHNGYLNKFQSVQKLKYVIKMEGWMDGSFTMSSQPDHNCK